MTEEVKVPVNPLTSRLRLPGETHSLPSRGLFYKDGELAPEIKGGEVHIHAMTTYEEIVLRSPDLLFSGEAVRTVIGRCVPGVLKPEKLLSKDVDFIMMVLRKASYGNEFEIKYQHTCDKGKSNSYIIPLDEIIRKTKNISPTDFNTLFCVKMPNDQVVKLMPVRYEGVIRLLQTTDRDLSPEKKRDMLTEIFLDWIESVDGITEKELIKQWLMEIPVGYAKAIEGAIDSTQSNWGPDFYAKLKCRDCGETTEINTPINPLSFFT
jgi:hypothetical protein